MTWRAGETRSAPAMESRSELLINGDGPPRRREEFMPSTHQDAKSSDRYLELVRAFPLRPIRTTADLDRGLAVLESLLGLGTLDVDEKDYVDVLADLIEKFEASEQAIPAVSEAEMLRHLIDARAITQARPWRRRSIRRSLSTTS